MEKLKFPQTFLKKGQGEGGWWEEVTRDQTEGKKEVMGSYNGGGGWWGAIKESRADPQGKQPTWEVLRLPRDVGKNEMQRSSEEGSCTVTIIISSNSRWKGEDPRGNRNRFLSARLINRFSSNKLILS